MSIKVILHSLDIESNVVTCGILKFKGDLNAWLDFIAHTKEEFDYII